jgi:hypothetical protein
MANNAVRTANIAAMNSASRSDTLIVSRGSNGQTRSISVLNLMANSDYDAKAANLYITYRTTPANSTANCTQNQIWFDNTHIFVAVSNNNIKRVALDTF